MDRVFSVDEIAETFWPVDPPVNIDTKINRSSSEWTFQRFLEEASKSEQVASAHDSSCVSSVSILPSTSCSSFPNGNSNVKNGTVNDVIEIKGFHFSGIPADSEEYQAILKHQLSLACAAVARSRQASSVTSKESLPLVDKRSPATDTVPSAPESLGSEYCVSRTQDKSSGGSTAISALSVLQKNSGVQMKQTTSESSREQSDEDDLEAETENTENMHPNDAKRVRRMISNRESARRSRRRKQAHLTELETRVGQLRVENSSLMKRLTDISQKYNEASVDNRILKADVETLRAKVKMAEDTVKRVTGLNPPLQTIPDGSSFSIPFTRPETIDTSIPVPEDQNHFFQPSQDSRLNNGITPVLSPCLEDIHNSKTQMGRSTSMQRVASLEHLQKRIRPGSGSCGIPCSGTQSGM